MVSFGDGIGTNQRAIVLQEPTGPNGEVGPSSAPGSGGNDPSNFLHFNPYPNTASPGQNRECEAGNEVYAQGQVAVGNVPGNQGILTRGQILAQTKAKKKKKGKGK
jgi:phospholipid/cholesterol/gamma-HCH transport system substrate-binding protein